MNNQKAYSLIRIDLRSGTPAYLQIIQKIQGLILNQELKPGDQLPTVRQLAAQLSINFNTIARAYRLLDKAGTITTQQGRGTYVLDNSDSQSKLREEVLTEIVAKIIVETSWLGYTSEEVQREIRKQLENK